MKRAIQIFLIYVLVQQSGETVKRTWSDDQPVDTFLSGRVYQVVSKRDFDAIPENIPDDPVRRNEIRQAILDARNVTKSDKERLEALIKAVLQ